MLLFILSEFGNWLATGAFLHRMLTESAGSEGTDW